MRCVLQLDDLRDLTAAVARCRRLLDLDADPVSIAAQLEADPLLGALARRRPGMRVPGCVDGFELAVRAIVGQQVSVAAARTVLGRLVAARYGEPLAEPAGTLAYRFPTAEALAEVDPADLPFPRKRGEALRTVARLVAEEDLRFDAGADASAALAALLDVPGVGPWTASYVAMRALGRPGRVPGGRRRHPARAPAARSARRGAAGDRARRALAAVALLRGHAPVGSLGDAGPLAAPGGGLRADQLDQVAQGDVRVHQVQAPAREWATSSSRGALPTGLTSRTFAPPADEQRAR